MRDFYASRNLYDVISQYARCRKKQGYISTSEATRTISLVIPVNVSNKKFESLIADAAAANGLAIRFDQNFKAPE